MNDTLQQFNEYCQAHPELTFWAALLEWTKNRHDASFGAILVEKNGKFYNTVEWTGEDNPMMLFGNEYKK